MPVTALLVEDEEILRSLIVDALSLIDVEVVQCASADEALALLEAPNCLNLVITDICMPGSRDGVELAKIIWARWPDLPVILSSANRVVLEQQLPENASFLRKPWALDDLHQLVGERLNS